MVYVFTGVVFSLILFVVIDSIHNVKLRKKSIEVQGQFFKCNTYNGIEGVTGYYPVFKFELDGQNFELQAQDACRRNRYVYNETCIIYVSENKRKCFTTRSCKSDICAIALNSGILIFFVGAALIFKFLM